MTIGRYALLASTVALAACQTVSPEFRVDFLKSGTPGIAGQNPHLATAIVTVIRDKAMRQTQNVSGLTYDTADLSLTGTRITGTQTNNVSMSTAGPSATVFQALPPGNGYNLAVSLRSGGATGTEVGNGTNPTITLVSGLNHVTVIIAQDGKTTISNDSQNLSDGSGSPWIIYKGDTVQLNTGFLSNETNVASMSISLGSTMYAGATSQVIAQNITSGFDKYSWNTGSNIGAGDSTAGNYKASDLTLETGGDTITFDLYNSSNQLVGISKLSDVQVVSLASFDLTLQ